MKSLFNINDQKTEFKADYGQILNYFKNTPKHEIIESFEVNENRHAVLDSCLDDRPNWKGGTFQDIFKDTVITTKQSLDGVKPVANLINKRKRFLSEHDGDYVHERRYDINFMESARREKVQGSNLIRINACGSFSALVDAEKIDAFAREVCELVNFFESQGRSVELNLMYKSDRNFRSGQSPRMNGFITVKQPDKYLSKADIYRAFSTVFFRHIGFCIIVLFADANEKAVDESLGTPVVQNNKIDITPNEINIHGLTAGLVNKIKASQKESA